MESDGPAWPSKKQRMLFKIVAQTNPCHPAVKEGKQSPCKCGMERQGQVTSPEEFIMNINSVF